MNRLRGKNLMWVALITLLILNMYTVIPSKAQEDLYPTDVSIQPPSISWTYPEHDLLETFNVTLYVHNVTDLLGWQAGLYFNPDVLNVTYFEEGPFLKQGGTTFLMSGTIDNTTGVITFYGVTLTGTPWIDSYPQSGSGDLAYIGFQVINYGNSTLDLTTTDDDPVELILVDPDLNEIPCDVYDGYFELPQPSLLPPGAYFTFSPISPFAGDTVTFDATTSIDGWNGTGWSPITIWDWDFGDGTTDTSKIVEHVYAEAGTYTVTLTVTDNDGLTDTDWKSVTIKKAPVASFTYSPEAPTVNEDVMFDASSSTPDGGELIDPTSYAWDFGEGTTGSGEIVSHTYSVAGDYNVTLTVTDNQELLDTYSKIISVREISAPAYSIHLYALAAAVIVILVALVVYLVKTRKTNVASKSKVYG